MLATTPGPRKAEEKGARGMMIGWASTPNGHEFECSGADEGQGSLACCSSHGLQESDTAEQLNNNKLTEDFRWG